MQQTVYLFDVDNTLLDNDRVIVDLRTHLMREVGAGLRWTWDHRAIRALVLVIAAVNLLAAATAAVLVLYALEVLRAGSGGYALVLAAGAAGVMIGSLSAGWVGRRLGVSPGPVAS